MEPINADFALVFCSDTTVKDVGPSRLGLSRLCLWLRRRTAPPRRRVSRFVRAVVFSQSAAPSKTADDAVLAAFHILNQFDIPDGSVVNAAVGQSVNEITEWKRRRPQESPPGTSARTTTSRSTWSISSRGSTRPGRDLDHRNGRNQTADRRRLGQHHHPQSCISEAALRRERNLSPANRLRRHSARSQAPAAPSTEFSGVLACWEIPTCRPVRRCPYSRPHPTRARRPFKGF